jgi:hypothetical protein
MLSSKIMWNSVISTPDARFAGADIKNMYLETPLDWYEYMRMPLDLFPDNIVNHNNLRQKAKNGFVYMEIHGLPQAGILANTLLKKWFALHGYFEQPHTPGLWKHVSHPVWFNLCDDDFGIKYIGKKSSSIYTMPSEKKHTKLLRIMKVNYIVAYLSSGITRNNGSTHQWHSML